jgi:hypothetical protein
MSLKTKTSKKSSKNLDAPLTRLTSVEPAATDLDEIIAQIRHFHRQRVFAMEQRKRSDLALGAFLRLQLGWQRDAEDDVREKAMAEAAALIKNGEAEYAQKSYDYELPHYLEFRDIILASIGARSAYDKIEDETTKQMELLAKKLPIWTGWAKDVRGLGARSVAVITAETGNLSNYATHQRVWKRMGLAVIDGRRQGNPESKDAQTWIAHGYSPKRRSHMFVIGDVMVKVGDHYRQVYLDRKIYEKNKVEAFGLTVLPSAKIPKAQAEKYVSEGHIHNRSRRYMEKVILADMWKKWHELTPKSDSVSHGVSQSIQTVIAAEPAEARVPTTLVAISKVTPPQPPKSKAWKLSVKANP